MIKSKTYKLISLTMALLIFFSSSGLTLDVHFCQGEMKRLNLFGIAKSCDDVNHLTEKCHHRNKAASHCDVNGDHSGCCDNKSVELDMKFDSEIVVIHDFSDEHIKSIKAFPIAYCTSVQHSSELDNYENYYPPPLELDRAVLFQTFLL